MTLEFLPPVAKVGGVKQSTFCMVHRKTMITMGSPYFVWINANEIISSWYLLGAVCVTPPAKVKVPPGASNLSGEGGSFTVELPAAAGGLREHMVETVRGPRRACRRGTVCTGLARIVGPVQASHRGFSVKHLGQVAQFGPAL
jgi:hypothetical protein